MIVAQKCWKKLVRNGVKNLLNLKKKRMFAIKPTARLKVILVSIIIVRFNTFILREV